MSGNEARAHPKFVAQHHEVVGVQEAFKRLAGEHQAISRIATLPR